ncbi:helix-turn-helix domain-containing protein [Paenibacillus xerothermodurans]|nr:helix-turn-helix domain-containing protein [Paenibacillus xerothermodurans]
MLNRTVDKNRVFIRLLAPYIVFLLLAMAIGWVIYQKTLIVVEKEVTANNMDLLEQSKSILDRRFAEITSITMQVANDPRIMQFQHISDPFAGANTFRILEARKGLYNFTLTNNFIYDYYVFFKNSELALTANSTYLLSDFYTHMMHYDEMDYSQWRQFLFGSFHSQKYMPAQDVVLKGSKQSMLTYVQSIGYPGFVQGVVAVMIDHKEIRKLLSGLDLSQGGWAYIVDDKGTIISSYSSGSEQQLMPIDTGLLAGSVGSLEQTVGGSEMMITYTKSSNNGWTYLVVQPSDVVLGKVRYIQKISFISAFVFLLLGTAIAYLLAYRSSRPLIMIVNTLLAKAGGKHRESTDAFAFIREAISGLADNNAQLQEEIKQQAPLLQAALFERLLRGEFISRKDTAALLQHTGMANSGPYYVVTLLQLRGWELLVTGTEVDGPDVQRVVVKDFLRQMFGEHGYIHDAADDQIVLLYSCGSRPPAECCKQLETLLGCAGRQIADAMNLKLSAAIGGIYAGLTNVSRSYEEARHTLQYQAWERKDAVLWFHQLPTDNNDYYYPGEMEVRLMNLAKAGEWNDVESLLLELRAKNLQERQLSCTMMQLFLCEIWGTVVKLLPQIGLNEESIFFNIKSVVSTRGAFREVESSYASIINTYRRICDHVNEHKKSKNSRLMEDMITLLNSSYMQSELSLDYVADRFEVTKVYVSQFFKEQTGVNFFDYLENLRMNQAKRLLLETNLSVNEIANRVGYNSSNTFCRAFKRLNGVSTTSYRQSEQRLRSSV